MFLGISSLEMAHNELLLSATHFYIFIFYFHTFCARKDLSNTGLTNKLINIDNNNSLISIASSSWFSNPIEWVMDRFVKR